LNFRLKNFGSKSFGSKSFAPQNFASQILQAPSRLTQITRNVRLLAIAVLAIAMLAALPAHAQSRRPRRESNANRKARIARNIQQTYNHRWEVGGGGGYIRFRSGESLQKNSEIAFWTNTTYFLTPKLGITGEIRGGFGNAKLYNSATNFGINYKPQISEYPFMAGATYRAYRREKFAISGFALAGTAIGKFDGDTKGVPGTNPALGLWPSTNARPAFSIGANLDLNLYPNIAFRIAPSYLGTTFGSTIQNNAGFEVGIVYRFGHQK
jgi:hypothetical protein